MTVFKACMKVFKKNSLLLAIYFVVFTLMSISASASSRENAEKAYETANVRVSVINNDDSPYGESLEKYLDDNAKMVEIVESEEGISDALFYRYTEYVIRIPEGFGEKLAAGENVTVDKYQVSGSYSGVFMDNMVNEYISKMKVYGPEVPETEGTKVELAGEEKEDRGTIYLYNFASYCLMAIIMLGVGALLATFNRTDIRKRNLVSPVSGVKTGMLQIAACLIFTIIVWVLIIGMSIGIVGPDNIKSAEVYMIINTFVYSMVSLAMGFCLGSLVKSENGRNIVTNVVTLGFSFIGGVMIPLSMIGDNVKIIGSFTPTYWFVTANEALTEAESFAFESLGNVWQAMGIELLFFIAFIAIGMAGLRKRAVRE